MGVISGAMKFFVAFSLALLSFVVQADAVRVDGARLWSSVNKLQVVFDIGSPLKYKLFQLKGPDRVVIDLVNAKAGRIRPGIRSSNGWLKGIRAAPQKGGGLRIVLDLSRPLETNGYLLKPSGKYGHRLVVDLMTQGKGTARFPSKPAVTEKTVAKQTSPKPQMKVSASRPRGRDIVIAIDAGHGGQDPGAIGKRKTREKDVVLAIARKLQSLIDGEPGMRAVLIRDGDYFVGLRERIRKAREHKADLFISIHADSFKHHRARGSSVFTLSMKGASSEAARWLAEKENAADLIGGVSLGDKDDMLASVLLDLSQTATIEASTKVASQILEQLGSVNRLHKSHVEQAGFAVLKSPDIPSVLVETAFISNPEEERKLRNRTHQKKLARAILKGVRAYFEKYPPPGTYLALRREGKRYVIRKGDTISTIARRYRVRMDELRRSNGLESDLLKVGDVLLIPGTLGG